MFKKLLSALLCLLLVFSLSACSISFELPFTLNESNPNTQISLPNQTPNSSTQSSTDTPKKPSNNTSSGTPVEKPSSGQSSETEVNSPAIEAPVIPDTSHTPVLRENYYQYSNLTETEKKIYNDICTAIETTQNVINLSKYRISYNKMWEIFQKLVADNPQYFWVSKFIEYTHLNQNGNDIIIDLILHYTDGDTTDSLSGNKFKTMASRDKISAQIAVINQQVEAFLSTVPTNLSDLEKEYLIHNAIVNSISYDHDAVGKELTLNNYSRVYDIYGTLFNQKAVCEGYSRLFQYLCYQVGINCTIVHGTSENQAHAWNAVKLNNNWYHLDVTWNDSSNMEMPLYDYFNLTTNGILKDHTIDYEELAVPNANANEYSFTNTFGMQLESLNSAPLNYQKAIDNAVKFNSPYIYIMVNDENISHSYSNYLTAYFFSFNSEIQRYIRSKGYNLRFEDSKISYTSTCIFIKRK